MSEYALTIRPVANGFVVSIQDATATCEFVALTVRESIEVAETLLSEINNRLDLTSILDKAVAG